MGTVHHPSETRILLAEETQFVSDKLRDLLAARGEPWAALVITKNLRAAVNQQMVGLDAPVREGDEVAFFPPVTGG